MTPKRRLMTVALMALSCFGLATSDPTLGATSGETQHAPVTQPAPDSKRTPAEQLSAWQDDFEHWTPDQAMIAYATHNDVERAMARAMSVSGVATQQLVRLARERWGVTAEVAVAHACFTDARADDKAATTELNGDHAKILFHSDDITDLALVREHDSWRIDVAAYVQLSAGHPEGMTRAINQSSQIVDRAMADVRAGKYQGADDLVKDLRTQLGALVSQ
jgi:hypothetical protein